MTQNKLKLRRYSVSHSRTKCPKCKRKAYYRALTDDFRCHNCNYLFEYRKDSLYENIGEELKFYKNRGINLERLLVQRDAEINFLRLHIRRIHVNTKKLLEGGIYSK